MSIDDEFAVLSPDLEQLSQPIPGIVPDRKVKFAVENGSASSMLNTDNFDNLLVCLISDGSKSVARKLARAVEQNGWRPSVGHNGEAALRLLRMQHWNAVFLDKQMPLLSEMSCMSCFREWENQNRVTVQNNVYFVSRKYVCDASQGYKIYPTGFSGSLGKPVKKKVSKRFWKKLRL
mmetsp:Transcript_46602/g.54469  ORF Transcript_46602/g.54469 Transcript_46602/m.54469 type:complete len:177 (-) Transcript_46602:185-715(-)